MTADSALHWHYHVVQLTASLFALRQLADPMAMSLIAIANEFANRQSSVFTFWRLPTRVL